MIHVCNYFPLQLVEESSDKQEALQVICNQQTPPGSGARLPEGKAEGEFK